MGLVRNERGMKILNPASGRMESVADPEVHISRLAHFGAGMGVDLTGLHPLYSAKGIGFSRHHGNASPESHYIHFNSHDEGLELPYGILDAAHTTILDAAAPTSRIIQAQHELDHRFPYQHSAWGRNSFEIDHGTVFKALNARVHGADHPSTLNDPYERPLEQENYHTEFWGKETGLSHNDALQRTRKVFGQFRRIDQRVPLHGGLSPEARDLMEHGLANPDPEELVRTRRNFPNHLGPQFLSTTVDDSNWLRESRDMIDLKTGTWAKIHPDEYFPDTEDDN